MLLSEVVQKLRIIHQDEYWVAVDKPSGLLVHPPEDPALHRYTSNQPTVMKILKEQLGQWVYPVHRLDGATSGVLIMALTPDSAKKLQALFQAQQIQKKYVALVRGFTEMSGVIDSPLSADDEGEKMQDAITHYETLHRFELPIAQGKHESARFSLVLVEPQTGRYHQIRRHFKRIFHPLMGDTVHGDGKQNRIWRELTGESRLYLKAYSLSFSHPETGKRMQLHSRWSGSWQKVFDRAGCCPCL
jgi:tRNA pseudouridine65 synthase